MTRFGCEEMRLLIQAEIDGELDAARATGLAAHLDDCPDCARLRESLVALSATLRKDIPYHAAPAHLRQAVQGMLRASAPAPARAPATPWFTRLRESWQHFATFGAGAAVAAALVLALLPGRPDMADAIVADHIRALQPGHLIDVISTDQHTVKPWFNGRLDFSPPVKDFASAGFPLSGGRLDYLGGRAVAVLIYHRAKHAIDVYVWPARNADQVPVSGERNGYNFIRWTQDGMVFWAVSDVNAAELQDFVRLWRAGA